MSKLSDTQAMILSAAAQRPDGNLLPLPGSLRGGAAGKVVMALLTRGLICEEVTDSSKAAASLNTVWRNEDDGGAVMLRITPAGFEAIGVERAPNIVETEATSPVVELEPASAPTGDSTGAQTEGEFQGPATVQESPAPGAEAQTGKVREGTKQAQLIAMLERPEGATIERIVAVTGWQPHTVRGAFAGALKKRLGLSVASEKVEGRGRVYWIAS
jgi:hypothetical protein